MQFVKYQGTGNDFIIIDNRNKSTTKIDVAALCHRRFGIGADGLMLLEEIENFDFQMIYYNSDGKLSSMCGNGGRCISHFAHSLGLGNKNEVHFLAVDGEHFAKIDRNNVSLGMIDVKNWEVRNENTVVLNTGSPHFVQFITEDMNKLNLVAKAREIRYNKEFADKGINVNFVLIENNNLLQMRTYERGVEDETYSCGTGVTAAALAYKIIHPNTENKTTVVTPGGTLRVEFDCITEGYENVILTGPVAKVFEGNL